MCAHGQRRPLRCNMCVVICQPCGFRLFACGCAHCPTLLSRSSLHLYILCGLVCCLRPSLRQRGKTSPSCCQSAVAHCLHFACLFACSTAPGMTCASGLLDDDLGHLQLQPLLPRCPWYDCCILLVCMKVNARLMIRIRRCCALLLPAHPCAFLVA